MRRYRVPSSSALVAFESAARHCNFRAAAEELHTSQSAISRHIKGIEDELGAALFERHGRGLALSIHGRRYYHAVVSALENLASAARDIGGRRGVGQVLVACSHSISHLYLMPRFEALQAAVGPDADVRVMTLEYELQDALTPRDVDVSFAYRDTAGPGEDVVRLFDEEVRPVCSRGFLERHRDRLAGTPADWRELPLLDLGGPNYGWASWPDWFRARGVAPDAADGRRELSNYVYVLEAAAAGRGLALGWTGLVERYLDSGMLTAVDETPVRTGGGFHAVLSPGPERADAARRLVDALRLESAA